MPAARGLMDTVLSRERALEEGYVHVCVCEPYTRVGGKCNCTKFSRKVCAYAVAQPEIHRRGSHVRSETPSSAEEAARKRFLAGDYIALCRLGSF